MHRGAVRSLTNWIENLEWRKMSKIREEGYKDRKWEDEPRVRESRCRNQGRRVNGNTNPEPFAKHSPLALGTHYGDLPFLFESLRYDVTNEKLRDKGRPPLWCRNDRSEPNLFCAKVRFRRLSEQEMTYLRFTPLLQLQPLQIAHRNQFRAFSIIRTPLQQYCTRPTSGLSSSTTSSTPSV